MAEITDIDRQLVDHATEALKYAYSPYSNYRVGAAVQTSEGKIYTGCNVENSSYGLTNCAERTALFKAVSVGEREFDRIAIVVENAGCVGTPCGACRQVITEFNPQMEVLMANTSGMVEKMLAGELLPKSFACDNLEEEKIQPGV